MARLEPDRSGAFARLEAPLATLEQLGRWARHADWGDATALESLGALMAQAIESSAPAPRPEGFTLQALREVDPAAPGLPFPTPGFPALPCLVAPELFGRITRGVLRLGQARGKAEDAAIEDALWQGLWAVFELHRRIQPLALLHRAELLMQRGAAGPADFARIAAVAVGSLDDAWQPPGPHSGQPIAGELPMPPLPRASLWFDHCRAVAWGEAARAVRCFCTETYSIESIRNVARSTGEEPVACVGEAIEIRGRGFGDSREWGVAGRLSDVLFPGPRGTRIPATEYLPLPAAGSGVPAEPSGWTDTRIRVVVPAGARRGDVTLSVLCRTRSGGRPLDPVACRFPTRLPSPVNHPFLEAIGPLSLRVLVTAGGSSTELRDPAPVDLEAEACQPVTIRVDAVNAQAVVLREPGGDAIPVEDASPLPFEVRWAATVRDAAERTFVIEATTPCGATQTRTVRIGRFRAVSLEPATQALDSGGTGRLHARVSCALPAGGTVRVAVDNRWVGVSLPEGLSQDLAIPPGSDRSAPVELATEGDLCGLATLAATLVAAAGAAEHRPGVATVRVDPVPITTTFTVGTAVVLLDPPVLERSRVDSGAALGTASGRFSADRTEIAISLPETFGIDPVTVRVLSRDVTASHDPATGHFGFTLRARVEAPFHDASDVTIALSSTFRADRAAWGDDAESVRGLALGAGYTRTPEVEGWEGHVAGEATASGGSFDGVRLALRVGFFMPHRGLRTCGLEPPLPEL